MISIGPVLEIPEAAKWIWDSFHENVPNCTMRFRRAFQCKSLPDQAWLYFSAETSARVFVNGRRIAGRAFHSPESSRWVQRVEIQEYLVHGRNTLGVEVYNHGSGAHFTPARAGGLLAWVEVDGQVILGTDSRWQVREALAYHSSSGMFFWTGGYPEVYEPALEESWLVWEDSESQGTFFDSWACAVETAGRTGELILDELEAPHEECLLPWDASQHFRAVAPDDWYLKAAMTTWRKCPQIYRNVDGGSAIGNNPAQPAVPEFLALEKRTPVHSPGTFLQPPPGEAWEVLLDLERERFGSFELEVESQAAGLVDLAYTQWVDPESGEPDLSRLYNQWDRLIVGGGTCRFEGRHTRACRYVLLSFRGFEGGVRVRKAAFCSRRHPTQRVGTFESPHGGLDAIYEISRSTLEVSMQNYYVDSWREKACYAGDFRTSAWFNYALDGDLALVRRCLLHFVGAQREDGWFKTMGPSATGHNIVDYMLDWVQALAEYFDYSGDREFASALLPNARKVIGFFEQFQEEGLIQIPTPSDWWVFLDWSPCDRRGTNTGLNALFAATLTKLARLEDSLSGLGSGDVWRCRADQVRVAIRSTLWNPKDGLYADARIGGRLSPESNRITQLLAAEAGLFKDDEVFTIWERMKHAGVASFVNPLTRGRELDVLSHAGLPVADGLQQIEDFWGAMRDRGATTWWETFDSENEENEPTFGSLCHAWGCAPIRFLRDHLAGVEFLDPGGSSIRIRPQAGDLRYWRLTFPTVHGPVEVVFENGAFSHSAPTHIHIDFQIPQTNIKQQPLK